MNEPRSGEARAGAFQVERWDGGNPVDLSHLAATWRGGETEKAGATVGLARCSASFQSDSCNPPAQLILVLGLAGRVSIRSRGSTSFEPAPARVAANTSIRSGTPGHHADDPAEAPGGSSAFTPSIPGQDERTAGAHVRRGQHVPGPSGRLFGDPTGRCFFSAHRTWFPQEAPNEGRVLVVALCCPYLDL